MKKLIAVSQCLLIILISSCNNNHINNQIRIAKHYNDYTLTSHFDSFPVNDTVIENLEVLAKVWGYVKYYHPIFEDSIFNIDYELFNLLPKVANVDPKDRNEVLSKWIDSLGSFESDKREYDKILSDPSLKMMTSLDWINDTTRLGKTLSKKLNELKYAVRSGKNYYGLYNVGVYPVFKNETPYYLTLDCGYRLLSLFRYWNVIEYYFPSKYITDNKWDVILTKFIPLFIKSKDRLEYKSVCYLLFSEINDTHAYYSSKLNEFIGTKTAPLALRFVEDKPIIVDFYIDKSKNRNGGKNKLVNYVVPINEEKLEKKSIPNLKIGDEVVMINHNSIDTLLSFVRLHTSNSNESAFRRNAVNDIIKTQNDNICITYRRGLIEKDTVFRSVELKQYLDWVIKIDDIKRPEYKLLNNTIGYIYPGNYSGSKDREIRNMLQNSKALIIDMRCYPKHGFFKFILKYLVPNNKCFAQNNIPEPKLPGSFRMVKDRNRCFSINKHRGKLVIIVDENTQSHAEYVTMALQTIPRSFVIGSTTAGADGNMSFLDLPYYENTTFSGHGVYYPDGTQTQRVGIKIDKVVKPTIQGYIEGRDELLEKAIEFINKTDIP